MDQKNQVDQHNFHLTRVEHTSRSPKIELVKSFPTNQAKQLQASIPGLRSSRTPRLRNTWPDISCMTSADHPQRLPRKQPQARIEPRTSTNKLLCCKPHPTKEMVRYCCFKLQQPQHSQKNSLPSITLIPSLVPKRYLVPPPPSFYRYMAHMPL